MLGRSGRFCIMAEDETKDTRLDGHGAWVKGGSWDGGARGEAFRGRGVGVGIFFFLTSQLSAGPELVPIQRRRETATSPSPDTKPQDHRCGFPSARPLTIRCTPDMQYPWTGPCYRKGEEDHQPYLHAYSREKERPRGSRKVVSPETTHLETKGRCQPCGGRGHAAVRCGE